jgi:anti-sigma B factor antagonist
MNIHSKLQSDVLIVTANISRIDAACAIQFKDKMRELTRNPPKRVVLDLADVDFVDSSGLGAIVVAMKQLGLNTQLELAALTPTVEKVFRLTQMDSVFVIHDKADAKCLGT